ncbi:benzoate 1,2-dioxygenase electron transfer component BenC [Benzoatithermus flavus]|uniref:Benzoate 1,2-dioxygenase electron transfer component BenC n=1 Tax=Benzoatithermus flavus TaxID=3108223 RepID=A0ABU8XTS4_9PROT
MGHTVALNFEDGVTRFIECRTGETVADASYRVGINIPLDCRDGACGTCKCRVESGTYDPGEYIEDALSEEEAAEGLALACQMRPQTDLVISVAASSEVCKTRGQSFEARLKSVERLSATTIAFSLEGAGAVTFLPGQYVNVQVPGTDQRRSYSFSSPPGAETLSFLVRDIPPGLMSSFLRERAEPGMPMSFVGPAGSFYLRDIRRPLLFLAGGTGLAPFLSMLGKIAETGSAHPIHLVYGVTNDEDLVGVDRLEDCAARIPGFTFATCVAAEGSAHPRKGYVMAHTEPERLNGGEVDVYLCGPPAMVDAVRVWLGQQGVSPANFYYEKFSPSGAVTAIGESHRPAA